MNTMRVVIDTNILFEGLTRKGGAAGWLIEAWLEGALEVCVSNALAYEYADVLSRKLSASRWEQVKPVLGALLSRARFVTIYYSWRPASPDPGDDHVIDCAVNAAATLVSANVRDFRSAQESLGLEIVTASEAVVWLASEGEEQ